MASEFLKKKAQERAETIEKTYGSTAYGASEFLRRKAGVSTEAQNNQSASVPQDRVQPSSSAAGVPSTQPVSIQPDRLRPGWSTADLFPREEVEVPGAISAESNTGNHRSGRLPESAETPLNIDSTSRWSRLYSDGTVTRGQELAAKSKLTDDEKNEARAISKKITSALRPASIFTPVTTNETEFKEYSDLVDLNSRLTTKTSWFSGFGSGVVEALGLDWISDRTNDLITAITGYESGGTKSQYLTASAKAQYPGWNVAGNIAGSVAELAGVSNVVGGVLNEASWFAKLTPWLKRAVSSAITFGITDAAKGVTETQTKEEWDARQQAQKEIAEQWGATYTPKEYNAWEQLGKVGISAATGIASGALGSALGTAFGKGTSSILIRNGLQYNNALRAIAAGINGVGFAAGSTAAQEISKYLQYPDEYQASPAEIGTNLAVAFLFSTASSAISEIKTAKTNKEALLKMMDELAVEYESAKIKMAGMTGDARIAEAGRALELSKRIRTAIATSPGMSGVQEEVKRLVAALDIIDDQMGAILAGGNGLLGAADIMSEAGAVPGEPLALAIQRIGADVPAPTGAAAPTISASSPESQIIPEWYAAYQNAPRAVDRTMQQRPTLQLPLSPAVAEEAQGDIETVPELPAPQSEAQAPTEQRNSSELPNGSGLMLPSAQETPAQELTPAQEQAIVKKNLAYASEEGRELANALNSYNRIENNGFEYTVNQTSAGWIGRLHDIRGNKFGGMISDARALDYQTQALGSREEVIDSLVQVAERNNLLGENPGPHVRMSPEEEARIRAEEAARNAAEEKAPGSGMELPTAVGKLPHEVVAEAIRARLRAGNIVPAKWLQEIMDEAYGGTRGSGTYDIKTGYDALELGVNLYLLGSDFVKRGNGGVDDAVRTEKTLQTILSRIPTQTVRTEEQQQFQQFSTPPNIAYLAAWAAHINSTDTVLEPSAGIGGLALWPKAWGATVYGNELSPRRAEILRSLGLDEVFTENAEQINNVLPDRIKPTVVLMNPPFSATAGRLSKNSTANAKRHIEQALDRLEDGGRLVAILGQGMSNDSKTFSRWWNDLRSEYNIRANLSINGENYRKYGTTFDVQMVVIDKTGPQTGETITGEYTDLTEIPSVLEGIRDDRTQIEGRTANAVGRSDGVRTEPVSNGTGQGRPSGISERPSGSAPGNDGSRAPVSTGNRGRVQLAGTGGNGSRAGESNGSRVGGESIGSPGGVLEESQPERNGGPESALPVSGLTLPGPVATEEAPAPKAKPTAASKQKAGNDDNVFAEYIPPKTPVKGAKKHPAKLVESAAMAAVDAPTATYTPDIPKDLISSGALSDVQLTNIVYAGQAHSQMIPGQNKRKGYFIGDGTGVGKGRQLAGIILDNFRQGRTKAVWISKGQNLYPDAKRDWKAMGMDPNEVYTTEKIKADAQIKAGRGILFTTYDTLANKSKAGKSRLDQIVDWLGADFDGVICFDEAHTMGNLLGKQSKRGNSKPAQRAIAGAELQNRLPNARIVYASATMATDVSEMAFAERLGLWGAQTQFNNVRDFVSKISDGGMAAMELVARDMKAMGVYQARSISYDGVEYDTLQHDLSPMQKQIYNTMSRAWQITLRNMNKALEMTGANLNGNAKGKAKSAYYGALQRFYNQILTSMAVPSVIEDMKKELAKGRSIVIQIVNTNEAETERQLAKAKETGESLDDLDITPREALVGYLRNSFPVQVFQEEEDENGNKHSVPVTDSQGNPVLDKKAVAMRDALIAEINEMSVPEGPLEMIYDAFGTENVAEVTGRGRRIVPGKDEYGNTVKIEEKRSAKSGEADATAFQDGKKRILIFSDAGGTGKSYHADRTAINQQQRVHYLLQPGWSAPKAVQGFGRTHRSNEASAPIYKLVTTDVKGQKRFVSTIARRLDQLGALTKGQRQTGSGMFSARDNLESDLATDSLYNFYRALVGGRIEGLEAQDVLEKLGLMDKFVDRESRQIKVPDGVGRDMSLFLNRILALEYDEQNLVFDAFSRIFDDAYETALANGTLDMGMETVRADKIDILDDVVVREDPNTGAATSYVQAKLSEKARIVQTVDDLKALRGDFIGLYRKKNGDVVGVFRTKDKTEADGSVVKQYILQTPQESKLSRYVEKTLKNECTRIPEKEWKSAWAEEVGKAPEYIETVKHMLTGSLLPIWNRLPQSGNVRVQRLIADDGRQYLGRIIDPSQIDGVLKSLGVSQGRTKRAYTADDVIKRVYKGGDKAILEENRMEMIRRRVGNEWRIEITGNNLWYWKQQFPAIVDEYINYKKRYFIPNGEQQKPTLEGILAQNPVRDIESVRGEVEDSREASNFNGNNAPRHPENWTTTRVGDTNKTPMSGPDIVEMIRHDFDIPISTGNIRSANARAQYRNQPQTVRSKVANSIPDIAHELGHHLDNVFDIRNNISAEAKQEIIDAMPESFKAQYKKEQLAGEGIAEFLRRYLMNSETAAMDYPKFTEEFFGLLSSKTRAAVDKLADEVNAYYSLSEQTGNWPVHNREDKGTDYREMGEKLKDMNTHFRTLFIDSMEPIKQMDAETGGKAYLFATNAAYAGNRAYAAITGDLYDLRGNKLGVGLQKALEGIRLNNKKEYTDFGMYLICRHGPERLAEGMRVFNDDAWDNTAWMQQTAAELEEKYPNFEEAADRLEVYQRELIEAYGVASGLYSQKTIDEWYERWEHYVPFLRWFGDRDGKTRGQKQGFANQTGPYKKARGSGLDIINPVDNIMENTVRLITASIRNEVMQEITKAAEQMEGSGHWMEKVPMPLARKTWDGKGLKAKTLEEFDDYFTQAGKSLGNDGMDLIQRILDGAIDDLLVQYTRGKAHGDIVTVMKNGKPEYWKINDTDLLRSVTNMGPTRAGELLNYYGRVTRFITGNITGMNIVWSIASNLPRDIGTMFTFSKTKNIVNLLAGIGESYVNKMRGDKSSELYKEFMAMGGNSTSAQTADKDMAKKARKALQKQKTDWLNPLEWVEFVSDMIESGPRYSYYKICRTKYNMTPEEAFYAAMEITVNFKKAGVLSKEINILVPFFNAGVQGVDRAARWMAAEDIPKEDRKAGRTRRIAAYLGASLAIAALSMVLNARTKKKQEDLEKLSNYTKNNYFVVQMKNGKYFAIPKPRELAIPISLFERIMEYFVSGNRNSFDDFWEYATDNLLPGVVSGVAQGDLNSAIGDLGFFGTLHYLVSNQDFLGRPIVSGALENMESKDQYNQNTSKLAKLIGQAFNLSPQQIDFLGNNMFGGFWQWQKALAPVSGKTDLSLGVASKWVKDPLYSTDVTNRMYNHRDALEKKKNSNPGDMEIAAEYRTVRDTATFYGRYYGLAKNEEETERSREVRGAMLDLIMGVEENANNDRAYQFLMEVIKREGSTDYMPTVMDTTLKADDKKTVPLNSEEYFMLQTRYNSLYYNYIRQAMDNRPSMSDEEKTATIEAAKKIAGIVARGESIEAHGESYEAYSKVKDLLDDGIEEGDLINYLSARDLADADGSGGISSAELLLAAGGLKLPTVDTAKLIAYNEPDLGLKLKTAGDYGVDATEYGKVLTLTGSSPNQDETEAAIDAVYGRTTNSNRQEKAALWQAMNKGWSHKNNPYSQNTGRKVQNALKLPAVEESQDPPSSGLNLPTA